MIREMNHQRVQSADLRQLCAEMERRLSAGENSTAESLLASHSQLASDTDAALEVIYTEFVAREHLGQQPVPAEFCQRFPQFRDDLEKLFQIHDAAGGANAVRAVRESALPLPDGGYPQAMAEPNRDRSRRRLGSYEILEEIGRGGMGVVYKARQMGLNRIVALKMILTGDDAGPGERARFRAEAEAAARLQHPNIVQIHEVGEHEGRPFLAFELIEGGSLDQLLKGSPLPAANAARLVETLARAIHYAHEKGVVHRDLKPANILLTGLDSWQHADNELGEASVVKITDFGLASRMPSATLDQTPRPELTAPNAIIGTPAYMAPEQAGVKGQSIGPASDVYALGAILYELLTGRPPFQGVDVLETLEQVRNSDPVPPGRLMPRLPRDIETICMKCLRKEPDQRYTRAADLADDIGRFLRGEPILARSTPAWEKAWKLAKRRPVPAGLLLVLAATFGIASVSVTVLWRKTTAALHDVQQARDETETELAAKLVALARRDWMANDFAAARQHLDECPLPRRGAEWRYLDRVCNSCLLILGDPNAPASISSLSWSFDGKTIAANHNKETLRIWDADTGRERFATTIKPAGFSKIAFDRNGRLVSIGTLGPTPPNAERKLDVRIWDISTRQVIREFDVVQTTDRPALNDDARTLAVSGKGGVSVYDVLSGRLLGGVRVAEGHEVRNLSLDAAFQRIALHVDSRAVFVWDVRSRKFVGKVRTDNTTFAVLSRDGERLALVKWDATKSGIVEIWDYQRGKMISSVRLGSQLIITAAEFSPDGDRLATVGGEFAVKVWDVKKGVEQFTFRGHTGPVASVSFSPDGQRLASGAYDGTVRIWDVRPLE